MDASIRRRAVRQAAKMALGAAFVGCGGAIATANDGSTTVPEDAGAKLACAVPRGDAAFPPSDQACWFGLVNAAVGDPGPGKRGAFTDPSLKACCDALFVAGGSSLVEYAYGKEPKLSYASCQSCADTVGDPVACTPWGPPMPPELEA